MGYIVIFVFRHKTFLLIRLLIVCLSNYFICFWIGAKAHSREIAGSCDETYKSCIKKTAVQIDISKCYCALPLKILDIWTLLPLKIWQTYGRIDLGTMYVYKRQHWCWQSWNTMKTVQIGHLLVCKHCSVFLDRSFAYISIGIKTGLIVYKI